MKVYSKNIYTDISAIEKELREYKEIYRKEWTKYDKKIKEGNTVETPVYNLIEYLNKLKKEKKILNFSIPKINWKQGNGTVIIVIAYKDLNGEVTLRNIFV